MANGKPGAPGKPRPKPPVVPQRAFDQDVADAVCAHLARGWSLQRIERECEWCPDITVIYRWLRENDENGAPKNDGFIKEYARARDDQADYFADDTINISDDDSNDTLETKAGIIGNGAAVARSRLRVDTRKWAAGQMKPQKYGKNSVAVTGPDGGAVLHNVATYQLPDNGRDVDGIDGDDS